MKIIIQIFLIILGYTSITCAPVEIKPLEVGHIIEKPKTAEQAQELIERMKATEEENEKIKDFAAKQDALAQYMLMKDSDLSAEQKSLKENLQRDIKSLEQSLAQDPLFKAYQEAQQVVNDYKPLAHIEETPGSSIQKPVMTYAEFKTQLTQATDSVAIGKLAQSIDPTQLVDVVQEGIKKYGAVPEKQVHINRAVEDIVAMQEDVTHQLLNAVQRNQSEKFNALFKLKLVLNEAENGLFNLSTETIRSNRSFWDRVAQTFSQWAEKFLSVLGLYTPAQVVEVAKRQSESNKQIADFFNITQAIQNDVAALSREIDYIEQLLASSDTIDSTMLQQLSRRRVELEGLIRRKIEALNESDTQLKSLDNAQQLAIALSGLAQRHKQSFETLFEKIGNYLENIVGIINPYTDPGALYELLGLDSSSRDALTQNDIEQAYTKKITSLEEGSSEYAQVQKAAFMLRSPEHRKTYNAFITDVALLGFLFNRPLEGIKTLNIPAVREKLNKGELAQLELKDEATRASLAAQADKYRVISRLDTEAGKTPLQVMKEQLKLIEQLGRQFANVQQPSLK